MIKRCSWCNSNNPLYLHYHDYEWGIPIYCDQKLFEMLVLEIFQSGLSWEIVLNKREAFRIAFDHFEIEKVAQYNEEKIQQLLTNTKIIRHSKKIQAIIANARVFQQIQKDWGCFSDYIWHFSKYTVLFENNKTISSLSDTITQDLKKKGMKFIGSTTIYSYLQTIGIIYSHDSSCFLYKQN